MNNRFINVKIGLEIHVQLSNAGSKLFCGCDSEYRGYKPNTNVCPVCLGLPGALPVPSRRPIVLAIAASMALGCKVPGTVVFTRKHYFYPDLPKNYQITQFEKAGGAPVCMGGVLEYLNTDSWRWERVRIRRINLEEDPGKTYYEGSILTSRYALVDYNRSGVPLLEIVTEPDIPSPRHARMLVDYLLLTLEYIGATNPRLEGVFRVDANISIEGGERVEVKNIGSTQDVEKALKFEISRQRLIVERGGRVERETRHWDAERGMTKPLRLKEEEADYLYFPDPDLPPIEVTEDMVMEAEKLASRIPSTVYREIETMGIRREIAWSITSTLPAAHIFSEAVKLGADPQIAARLVGVDLKGELKEIGKDIYDPANWPPPESIAVLSDLVAQGDYTYDSIKGLVVPRLAVNPRTDVKSLLPERVGDVEKLVEEVLKREEQAVKDYLSGKEKALNYLVGQVMKAARGRALDPRQAREILLEKLARRRAGEG
ncbi:aspartyl/glutamyl-tRNA(Asn/Gln) amidotransferase subunit B [Aeropyrum pernix]|uniref:Aspartyl/glutamyl-tRNA(Asn/Gln) amidotransferase subunit B n=1 Tax=Aeropyrum pernix TaxID=56636 RepID=A0A401HA38_AERPX|nr:Asp-tRNA(Asn)/Glu-tRNA(Gln) amidotransferase subunit GatB [Aeropyrum pernix]GBF09311.1 aspartyl/glutamyl-tRNA(Asn/Gln) amidotransferase subunit B [Aeropyrum pernix]